MINVTRLLTGGASEGDAIRYGEARPGMGMGHGHGRGVPKTAAERRPVVVWNITRTCNLHCVHCYSDSDRKSYPGELSFEECLGVIEDLAKFQVPAVLLSGGEPLIHPRFWDIAAAAAKAGLRLTLSTNGTLIDAEAAGRIRETGFSYVGVSLDGLGEVNDRFRGKKGAFDEALAGIRNLRAAGQKVGLRLTLTRRNYECLDAIFDLIEREDIARACFYHLVYTGRGSKLSVDDLSHEETRDAMDRIMARTREFKAKGIDKEILTVDNAVDGPYLYLKLLETDPVAAKDVLRLLRWNGGAMHGSGVGIGCIDTQGDVHADQFWTWRSFGNVRERPFSAIWTDESHALMRGLKHRDEALNESCRSCRFFKACGGAFRARADAVSGDPWAIDPACYLTDGERWGS
ncbi:MAG: radical SAM protein [Candidatus Methylomirabilis sp.]|nr:radical SAM protein [Deltaproteobacteria bacterium]